MLWEIATYLGCGDTRMVKRHYAHVHPDYQKKVRQALASLGGSLLASAHGVAGRRGGCG